MTTGSEFTECYVAFLDLMGVRNLVKRAGQDPTLYKALVEALAETKNISTFQRDERNLQTNETRAWRLQVQAFSDCVVLFIPTECNMISTECSMLPWLLASIRRLWDRLIRLKVCLRGAVTIGGMHWDAGWAKAGCENPQGIPPDDSDPGTAIALGPGLIEAYKLEDECAVYPRILISNSLYDHVEDLQKKGRSKTFPLVVSSAGASSLSGFFRQDFDGLWHLDVLHPAVDRRDVLRQTEETCGHGKRVVNHFDNTTREDWLEQVRTFIDEKLNECEEEKLLAKYQWLARYYNQTPGISRPFRIFQDVIPHGTVPLTVTTRQQESD